METQMPEAQRAATARKSQAGAVAGAASTPTSPPASPTTPDSVPSQASEAQSSPEQTGGVTSADLRAFIEHRLAQVYKPRLGGNIGGSQAMLAQQTQHVLRELGELADWIDAGRPGALHVTQEQLAAYKAARDAGIAIEIPAEIEALL
jgi:hypothetical protein